MRYQAKPYRSISYNQPALRDSKDNKENNNISNLPTKPLRGKDIDCRQPRDDCKPREDCKQPREDCRLKLQHKPSEASTTCTGSLKREDPGQELKRVYTEVVGRDYSGEILRHLCACSCERAGLLGRHEISSSLRSKMVDWMIEVLSSYRMSEETFFRSVQLMDAFLRCARRRLEVKDLHLIGVTAMFAAAKYEEIHPLKLAVVYDKIARKKFKKTDILEMESEIIEALDFRLETPTVYEIARHAMTELRLVYSDPSAKYLAKILLYLSKMVLFNTELAETSAEVLAGAVAFIALKTLEQMDASTEPERRLAEICGLVGCEEERVIEVSRRVLDLAKNFSKHFPTLNNLKKFNKFEYGSD